jgi:hypothetical protein
MKTKFFLFGVILTLTFFISCDSNGLQDTSAVTTEEIIADSNIDSAG